MQQNTQQALSLFNFNGHQVRVVDIDGAPWFVVQDIRKVIGFTQGGDNLAHLDANEKMTATKSNWPTFAPLFPGSVSRALLITESGLYKLVMRSDKPEAKAFQDWVAREVLPSIRRCIPCAILPEKSEA